MLANKTLLSSKFCKSRCRGQLLKRGVCAIKPQCGGDRCNKQNFVTPLGLFMARGDGYTQTSPINKALVSTLHSFMSQPT